MSAIPYRNWIFDGEITPYSIIMGIDVIGIGLDGASGLSLTSQKLIATATLLVGHRRHLDYFPHHDAPKLALENLAASLEQLREAVKEHQHIVILTSGDPLFFGLGRLLLTYFPKDQLRFHPHLSSIQLAFSRLKTPWQNAQILSAHGRSLDPLANLLQQGSSPIAILTDPDNTPQVIAQYTLALDLPTPYDIWLCENLGANDERVQQFSAASLEQLVSLPDDACAPLNIVILQRQELAQEHRALAPANLPVIGLSDQQFHSFPDRPGLMTKREIRLLVLGELHLQPQQVIWDIGAGTGAMSIEIARLCPASTIYAIEKTALGHQLIQQNCDRFHVRNVTPISGSAPATLEYLPAPHRIFIGGSGGQLHPILEVCNEKLLPAGIVVLAIATVEHFNESLTWFSDHHWSVRLLQIQLARSVPISHLTRMTPLNPVTLMTAHRQGIRQSQSDDR